MATSLSKSSHVAALVCLALLFAEEHIVKGDEERCEVPSGLFHGPCFDQNACNNLCKGAEGAIEGYCSVFECRCVKMCPKLCDRPSGKFHGPCFGDHDCDVVCKALEGAVAAVCRDFKCVCRYNCQN